MVISHPRSTRFATLTGALALALVAGSGPAAALPQWRTTDTVRPSTTAVKVLDLRHATHARFDRVVIDLRGRQPGYRIGYTDQLKYDGSGRPVWLAGKKKVSLVLNPAYAHDARGRNLYAGPRKTTVGYPTLRGIAFTGDYEAHVSFGFGTTRRAPYRVFTLTSPTRLVIDFKH